MIGKTLGHYRITEKLGEGGMGVVYKAQDLHLDRFVAIKILPPEKVADPERKRRFVQEAKAASALNHPNIIHVYDIDQAEGIDFIAMEYVDGKTLDQVIPRKGMRLNEALRIAVQIADALARAHSAGIMHRDLKPSNIMVDSHGLAKVLDFGLAKLTEAGPMGDDASTRTVEANTEKGTILGTVAYMSPEQAEGKAIDTRSDIFSFGAMLYEMLTGQRAFRGDTKASTIAAILKEEPKSISQVSEGMPRDAEKIVRRCLRKEVERRFQSMADVRVALEELKEETDSGVVEIAATAKPKLRRRFVLSLGFAAVLVAGAITTWYVRSRTGAQEAPPTVGPLVTYPGLLDGPTFSPDGNDIAFSWNGEKQDNEDIYRKLIGVGQPLRLTSDPAPDIRPAWSPNGRFIAFLRHRGGDRWGVFLVPALGGADQKVADVIAAEGNQNACLGLTWSPDGKWLVATDANGPGQPEALCLISVDTGEKTQLTSPPRWVMFGDRGASFSPDGRALAFARHLDYGRGEVYRLSLTRDMRPNGEPERLVYEDRRVFGLLWARDGNDILYSSGNRVTSETFLRRIRISEPQTGGGYRSTQEFVAEGARALAMSPNGRRLAYSRYSQDRDIYRLELQGKAGPIKGPEKFIASTRPDYGANYSPTGKAIAFVSSRTGTQEIWICNADGSNPRQLTSIGGPQTASPSWSPDGEIIAFDSRRDGSADVYVIRSNGGLPQRLTSDPSYEGTPNWSRDGRWIYFHSNRTGRREVFKIPAGGGNAVQVTQNGGIAPAESPDGKCIYFSKAVSGGGLYRIATTGGQETEVHPGPLTYCDDFAVVDDGIYFSTTDVFLQFLDFGTGQCKIVASLESRSYLGLTISPDRRWILYAPMYPPLTDLMLVENFR